MLTKAFLKCDFIGGLKLAATRKLCLNKIGLKKCRKRKDKQLKDWHSLKDWREFRYISCLLRLVIILHYHSFPLHFGTVKGKHKVNRV